MVDNTEVYKNCAKDIVERINFMPESKGMPELQARIKWEHDLFALVLANLVANHGGWMLLVAFTESFIQCEKTLKTLTGKEREVMQTMMQSVIGSFGQKVN